MDPVSCWSRWTPRQLVLMNKVAAKGKWQDQEIVLLAGGRSRKPPDWGSLSGVDHEATDQEVQRQLQEDNQERILEIHRRMRAGESLEGV